MLESQPQDTTEVENPTAGNPEINDEDNVRGQPYLTFDLTAQ